MRDQALLSMVQRKLLEPPTGGQSYASELWTPVEGYRASEQAQDHLLAATHCLVTRVDIPIGTVENPVGTAVLTLPADWLATVAAAWADPTASTIRELPLTDTLQVDLGFPLWTSAVGVPQFLVDAEGATRTVRLLPAPAVEGTLLLHYVARGPTITGHGVSFVLHDDLVYCGVQWGVLARLLGKVGRGADAPRAAYAQARVDLCETAITLLLGGFA